MEGVQNAHQRSAMNGALQTSPTPPHSSPAGAPNWRTCAKGLCEVAVGDCWPGEGLSAWVWG